MLPSRRQMLAAALLAPMAARRRAVATQGTGRVVDVVNSATSRAPAAAPQPLVRDGTINPGEEIHTDAHSAAQIALDDGSVVTVGAGVSAIFASGDAAIQLDAGALRFRTGAGAPQPPQLATPTLKVTLHGAEMIASVGEKGATTCGVFKGRIVCTSIKLGTTVEVAEGQSVRWADGAFGAGVTNAAYLSGDVAVDDGMAAARAAWAAP